MSEPDGPGFLDQGRGRAPSERLQCEFGLERWTAVHLVAAVGGRLDRARWLAATRSEWTLEHLLQSPVVGPLIDYDPRCTGPIPEGVAPGQAFIHDRVEMTPALALVLLENYTDGSRPLSLYGVDGYLSAIEVAQVDPEFTGFYSTVMVSTEGKTIAGQELLRAVVEWGRAVPVSVTHNVPLSEWRRMEEGRRRPPAEPHGSWFRP